MNIAINQTEQYKENAQVKGSYGSSGGNDKGVKDTASVSGSFRWDGPSSAVGNQAYRETKDKESALLDEASLYDTKNSKDFMVVMSNTLSDEDYKKLQEKGGNPGDYEPGEMVTVIDEIKVTLARAGVHIAGYTDDLDAGALKEAAGNEAYAAAIAHALEAKNLPVTEKNVKDCTTKLKKPPILRSFPTGRKNICWKTVWSLPLIPCIRLLMQEQKTVPPSLPAISERGRKATWQRRERRKTFPQWRSRSRRSL